MTKHASAPLRTLIAQHLDTVADATAAQIAKAVGQKDTPSRVVQELNAMRTDALIEGARKGKSKDFSYWLSVPLTQITNPAPKPLIEQLAKAPPPCSVPKEIKPGTRAAQIWDALRNGKCLTAREIASELRCSAGSLDHVISNLYKSKTIDRTMGAGRVFRYHRPTEQQQDAQPAVASNTGSNGSGSTSFPEAVAVPEKTATEAPASLSTGFDSVAADVTDDEPLPDADPALLATANRMLCDRLEGVAHALRGSGLPGLAALTGSEDLQPHVEWLSRAYQMALTSGPAFSTIDRAAEQLAAALAAVTPIENEVIDDMGIEALAERASNELHHLRVLADKLRKQLNSRTDECEALRNQLAGMVSPTLESTKPAGYIMTASKRKPRRISKQESAREAAIAAIRAGAQRAEVFALVPIGRAVRGAQWRES